MVVETNLELIEDAFSAEDIKPDAKTLRESNGSNNLPLANFGGKVVNIGRYKTPVTYHNHLGPAPLPVYADTVCVIYTQNGEHCSRINVDPNSVVKNCDGNYWQQVAFMNCVREFYKRQTISSSRGTRSTDGIL